MVASELRSHSSWRSLIEDYLDMGRSTSNARQRFPFVEPIGLAIGRSPKSLRGMALQMRRHPMVSRVGCDSDTGEQRVATTDFTEAPGRIPQCVSNV